MFLSLFGLIISQVLWIKYAIETEAAKFDQLVYDAMKSAVSKVERRNVYDFIDERIDLPEPEVNISITVDEIEDLTDALSDLQELEDLQIIQNTWHSYKDDFVHDSTQHEEGAIESSPNYIRINNNNIILFDSSNENVVFDYTELNDELEDEHEDQRIQYLKLEDSLETFIEIKQSELFFEKEEIVKQKLKVFNENIEQWAYEFRFDEDVDYLNEKLDKFEDIILTSLLNNGIDLDYNFQIIKDDSDTLSVVYSTNSTSELIPQQYKTEVFPKNIFTKGLFLIINFPGKNTHIYSKVYLLLIGSVLFTIIILLTFGITLYFIQKQKKLSEIKSDFINNMTHEFKTPIATIRLAADALESPKVMGVQDTTLNYLNIIRQENKRMNNQVERVLQMALIEQGKLQIDIQENNIHNIIQNCINVVELLAKKKEGKISSSLRATCYNINIDEIHIANLINNLLDNAIKYTNQPPDIIVETYNQQNMLYVRISDNGMGMSREVQKHIFDKFYRKPMGNIHNIKGFGLGLSYVKAVVEAHGANISVSSEPNNGSTFIIKFNC